MRIATAFEEALSLCVGELLPLVTLVVDSLGLVIVCPETLTIASTS